MIDCACGTAVYGEGIEVELSKLEQALDAMLGNIQT